MKRIDSVILQMIVTEYDANGVAVSEEVTRAGKVFRAHLATTLADVDAKMAEDNAKTEKLFSS